MPHKDYLRTPEWRARRDDALRRAGHRCQVCNGKHGGLQVHHRTYKRFGAELPEDLIVLCGSCHRLFHERIGLPDR